MKLVAELEASDKEKSRVAEEATCGRKYDHQESS
jgi:hypothetical protein